MLAVQEALDVNGLAEYLRERWAQLAGSRRQLQSSEQTQTAVDYRQTAMQLLVTVLGLTVDMWGRRIAGRTPARLLRCGDCAEEMEECNLEPES